MAYLPKGAVGEYCRRSGGGWRTCQDVRGGGTFQLTPRNRGLRGGPLRPNMDAAENRCLAALGSFFSSVLQRRGGHRNVSAEGFVVVVASADQCAAHGRQNTLGQWPNHTSR